MTALEIANEKTRRLIEDRFRVADNEVRSRSGGGLIDARTVMSIGSEQQSALQIELSKMYVATIGCKLNQDVAAAAIAHASHEFISRFKNNQVLPRFQPSQRERVDELFQIRLDDIRSQVLNQLQVEIHDSKATTPKFWRDKKYDLALLAISNVLAFVVGYILARLTK